MYAERSIFTPCLYTQVPWSKLGQEPVIVEFDRLYILAGPKAETDQPATSQVKQGSAAGFDSQLVLQCILNSWVLQLLRRRKQQVR